MTIVVSLLVFVLVILVHELGHFLTAKACGIRVNEFSIGMGPLLASKGQKETQYSLRALPIGGYVALEGEGEDSDDPRSFNNASKASRLAVLFSGSFMNFILAILLASIAFSFYEVPSTTVEFVEESSPAYEAGIEPGDEIISVDGQEIDQWNQIQDLISNSQGRPVSVEVLRGGQVIEFSLSGVFSQGTYLIGIRPSFVPADIDNPLMAAINYNIQIITELFTYLKSIFTSGADLSALSGPVGIVRIIGQSARSGLVSILFLTAMISANLGFLNLMPFPALDGGTILITIIEAIIGREISDNVKGAINLVGLSLLLGLMLYITIFNDILG